MPGAPKPEDVESDVVVYVTSYCGFCRAAERLLYERDIEFVAIDVTYDRPARAWLAERSQQYTVPQIFIRGQSIGGYSELSRLDARGELRPLLEREPG
ncbi:MAG: glutathione S-transferase N-terminal domain-containing protein [Myxococcales bacterium]|nr:glutathione S-transferase N-terminal domain-containing protein [Myxococcales bacterium]MCB9704607.1 glutathione S-transferase N-terminal domain-containing protein [Myxococcales bacterium]